MSYLAGVDYDSEAIHVAIIDEDDGSLTGTITADLACGPGDAFARARRVRDLMPARGSWRDAGVVAIALEQPFSRFAGSIAALQRVQGALLACLPIDVELRETRPQRWKGLTVGKTDADKGEVSRWAVEQGCPLGLAQDFYDAFCIARALRRALVEGTSLLRAPAKTRRGRGAHR